jgi:hypothetical protein
MRCKADIIGSCKVASAARRGPFDRALSSSPNSDPQHGRGSHGLLRRNEDKRRARDFCADWSKIEHV